MPRIGRGVFAIRADTRLEVISMDSIIVAEEQDFEGKPMSNGGFRWASTALFEQHGAQVTRVQHPPGAVVATHVHTVDEVFYLLDGELSLGNRNLPAGSVLFIGGYSPYGFTVGPQGVRWVMVRPNRADLAAADGTDYQEVAPEEAPERRGALLSPAEIADRPWVDLGRGALRRRGLIDGEGNPSVSLVEVSSANPPIQTAQERHQFLCVTAGRLRVGGRECGPGSVISIPRGESYTPAAPEGRATYLLIESALA
jgi:hypothetical protein